MFLYIFTVVFTRLLNKRFQVNFNIVKNTTERKINLTTVIRLYIVLKRCQYSQISRCNFLHSENVITGGFFFFYRKLLNVLSG